MSEEKTKKRYVSIAWETETHEGAVYDDLADRVDIRPWMNHIEVTIYADSDRRHESKRYIIPTNKLRAFTAKYYEKDDGEA